jgi:outer membrane protein OmpA-like peptidoglycan-associated protein
MFNAASPELDAEDRKTLDRVAAFMKDRGGQIVITGMARRNGRDSMKFLMNLSTAVDRRVDVCWSSQPSPANLAARR